MNHSFRLLCVLVFTSWNLINTHCAESVYKIPEQSVACSVSNYIVMKVKPAGWSVFKVQAIVLINRLVQRKAGSTEFVEEINDHWSSVPQGWHQIHVIVEAFSQQYDTEQSAVRAVGAHALGDSIEGVCRPISFFSKDKCSVISQK